MHLTHRQFCRVCGYGNLKPVIDLGPQHLQGSFVKAGMDHPPQRRIPCEIVRCDPTDNEYACGLLQMKHTVPPSILYSNYWYVSGTNQTMRDHLCEIAAKAQAAHGVESPPGLVLDIGCNDLTLLNCFPNSWTRVGIDPSNVPQVRPDGMGCRVINDLFPSQQLEGLEFDIITSIAMFYDLEDPVAFCHAIRDALSATGTWIVEMSYMPVMLDMNSYDTICHEHLEYYSFSVLEFIFKRAGLKCYRAELNHINGGSIRCYVTHRENPIEQKLGWLADLKKLRESEFDRELDTNKPYAMFQHRIEQHREDLMKVLTDLKVSGKSIHLYGASTKGNTLLQWCGIDSRIIDVAADRNPAKHGAFTLGTKIPIVIEEESRAMNPDYYLVLPWHFKDEFVKREDEAARLSGKSRPKLIFPLPTIEIV